MTRFYKITKKQQREAELSFVKTGLYYYTFLHWKPMVKNYIYGDAEVIK